MENELLSGVRDIWIEDNYMWVISDNFNCLFGYDFLKNQLDLIAVYPETIGVLNFAFCSLIKAGNEIYLFPLEADGIYIYDLLKKEFSRVNVPFYGTNNVRGVVAGEYLYCLKRLPDELIRIHLITKKTDVFHTKKLQDMNEAAERQIYRICLEPCLYQGKIVWVSNGNILILFDIETESFCMERLEDISREKVERTKAWCRGGLEDCIVGTRVFKEKLWLFSLDGRIYQYDDGLHKVSFVQPMMNKHNKAGNSVPAIFADLVSLGDELWFVPQYKRKCIKYNYNSGLYEECMEEYERKLSQSERMVYTFCKALDDKKIILYSYYESCFYIINTADNMVDKKKLTVPIKRFLEQELSFRKMIIRDNVYQFDDLNFFLKDTILLNKLQKTFEWSVGDKIFETIKQQ